MAGSQLRKLKSELKSQGLIGQTNVKNKKRPSSDRDQKEQKLGEIREKFNVFDSKINRTKRDVTTIENGKFVTVGQEGKNGSKNTSKTNSFLNKNLQLAYNSFKLRKGRNGRLIDKRFGENTDLGQEDKMLARFIKERESQSKSSKFSLESDDEYGDEEEDEQDFQLTHSGKALPEHVDESSNVNYVDQDSLEPARKKTKKEVMAEVIAKSKKYKLERQKLFSQTQDQIHELDDNFQDIMGEFQGPVVSEQKTSNKTQEEIDYDNKVRELVYDRRSVPADKTKTEEEIKKEYDEKMKKLEQDRLSRMEGDREAQGDDLDFWESESEAEDSESKQEGEEESDDEPMEENDFPEEFDSFHEKINDGGIVWVNKIIKTYKPHLREGNKARMNKFVLNLFKYLIEFDTNEFEELIKILKKLSESYNETLVNTLRDHMNVIQDRITKKQVGKSELIYFSLCGYLFSTSDKYHLIVIPNLILMNEVLISYKNDKSNSGVVVFVIDTILQYQRIAKRFVPEINLSISILLDLFKDSTSKQQEDLISIKDVLEIDQIEGQLINKIYGIIDTLLNQYKDYSILKIINEGLLPKLIHYQENQIANVTKVNNLIEKITRINNNTKLSPLILQSHKQLGIKTYQPKFEENFNPNKIYDNLESAEINKIKKQIKKEKKNTLKDLRSQNKFESNEQIKEKVKMYDDYHKKMANIVNSISTVEGRERNQYEKEKRRKKQ